MTSIYDTIEAKTGFRVPDVFRRMVTDGVTKYGADRAEWKATWRQRSIENPPALMLASSHVEWWAPEAIAEWTPPKYFDTSHKLIPFAANGAGDTWCWYPAAGGETIVLTPNDEEGSYIAPHLEGFLLRHLLQAFAEMHEDDGAEFTHEQRGEVARANVLTVAPYLRPEWVALLHEIAARPIVVNKSWRCLQLLTREEAAEIIERELAMSNLNEPFAHM